MTHIFTFKTLGAALTATALSVGVAALAMAQEVVPSPVVTPVIKTQPASIVAQNVELKQNEAEPSSVIVTMDLYNAGASDALQSVTSPIATQSEVNVYDGVVVKEAATIPVWTDHTINMQSTRTHVKLLGVTRALQEGEEVPVTLHFENHPDVTLNGTVTATLNDPFIERHVNYTIYQVIRE